MSTHGGIEMKRTFFALLIGVGAIVASAQEAPVSSPAQEPELRAELLRRRESDQRARSDWIDWRKRHGLRELEPTVTADADAANERERLVADLKKIDADNAKWLAGVVDRVGWPTVRLVGQDGADAAWLLVQHADADVKFQRRCLDLMGAAPKDEVSPSNLAYLTDRVLLAEGRKQRYGTQFATIDGKLKPHPVEDEANVDERRAEAGLQPLAEYAAEIERMYEARD
jgi:hypothetical protein